MKTVYFISGLGADERVFKYLTLHDVAAKYIKWEEPIKKENLHDYCKRLIEQIDVSTDVILIGVSFGGIVAQEIAKIIPVKKLIILSSVKTVDEFNWKIKLVRYLKLNRITPSRFLKWLNLITGNYYFGIKTKTEAELLRMIIIDTDPQFMVWAIEAIMQWEKIDCDKNIVHIHGDKDRIFPICNIKNVIGIKDGGHFMIVNQAAEISALIQKELD